MNKTVALPNTISECHELIMTLVFKNEDLHGLVRLANHKLYGQSSEQSRYIDDLSEAKLLDIKRSKGMIQLDLFSDVIEDINTFDKNVEEASQEDKPEIVPKEDEVSPKKRRKYKGKNQRIAEMINLRVVECHHGKDIANCPCCSKDNISKLGEEITQELDIIPAEVIIKKHVTHKFICNDCNSITRGDKPVSPLPGCMASAELLTHICHARFDLYIPYYRLNRDFETLGADISIQNMCNWMKNLSIDTLTSLYFAIKDQVLSGSVLYCDETTLKEMAKGKCKTKYIWEYINPDVKNVIFEYSDRSSDNPTAFLEDFKNGSLVSDKYSGYNDICNINDLIRALCWAHSKRKFHEIIKSTPDPNCLKDVKYIQGLISEMLDVDKEIRAGDYDQIEKKREENIRPLVDKIFEELKILKKKIGLVKGSLMNAINYTLENPDEFKAFISNASIDPTNNLAERTIRFLTLGRKNWLFAGNEQGGKTIAIILTIIASARMHNLNIREYLCHVIKNLPNAKQSQIDDFLPQNCQQFSTI